MARFKPIHKGLKLLPVDFDRQVIPGSFAYALCHLVGLQGQGHPDLALFHGMIQYDLTMIFCMNHILKARKET